MTQRKNARKTPAGRPFETGNPGRPRGARHRVTVAVEALLEGEAEGLTRKAIDMALGGDAVALRLCLERIAPRRDRPVTFAVGAIAGPSDALSAMSRVVAEMGDGEITPGEAAAVMGVVSTYLEAWKANDLEIRLRALEEKK